MKILGIEINLPHSKEINEILRILKSWEKEGIKVAESPEVTEFRAKVSASLENISADIQRLLDRNPSLNVEDKQALVDIADQIANVASVVPEE